MGTGSQIALIALNKLFDHLLDKREERHQDRRKLKNYENMENLKFEIENKQNPYAREAIDTANQRKIKENQSYMNLADLVDEVKRNKLENENLEYKLAGDMISDKAKYQKDLLDYQSAKLANDKNRLNLEQENAILGLLDKNDELNYSLQNKDKNRKFSDDLNKAKMAQIWAAIENTKTNTANAKERMALYREAAKAKQSMGGKGAERGLNPLKLIELKADINAKINDIYQKKGLLDQSELANDPQYKYYQGLLEQIEQMENGESYDPTDIMNYLAELNKQISESLSNKGKLINKSLGY